MSNKNKQNEHCTLLARHALLLEKRWTYTVSQMHNDQARFFLKHIIPFRKAKAVYQTTQK